MKSCTTSCATGLITEHYTEASACNVQVLFLWPCSDEQSWLVWEYGETFMTNYEEYKRNALKDPEVRREYDALQQEYDRIVAEVQSKLNEEHGAAIQK